VSTTGLSPVTVTVSSTADTSIVAFTSALKPIVRRMSCVTNVLNPGSSKRTV
jgi:hypothetical protein